jgi:hypothetical protein
MKKTKKDTQIHDNLLLHFAYRKIINYWKSEVEIWKTKAYFTLAIWVLTVIFLIYCLVRDILQ